MIGAINLEVAWWAWQIRQTCYILCRAGIGMEMKRTEGHEVKPIVAVKVDKFGFIKEENNAPGGLTRSRSAAEFQKYPLCFSNHIAGRLICQMLNFTFSHHFLNNGLNICKNSSYFCSFLSSFSFPDHQSSWRC